MSVWYLLMQINCDINCVNNLQELIKCSDEWTDKGTSIKMMFSSQMWRGLHRQVRPVWPSLAFQHHRGLSSLPRGFLSEVCEVWLPHLDFEEKRLPVISSLHRCRLQNQNVRSEESGTGAGGSAAAVMPEVALVETATLLLIHLTSHSKCLDVQDSIR